MTKQEFLDALRMRLAGELSPEEVRAQLAYYNGYFDGELGRGRAEEEILRELGDPVLIARTILDMPRGSYDTWAEDPYGEGAWQGSYGEERESAPGEGETVFAEPEEPETDGTDEFFSRVDPDSVRVEKRNAAKSVWRGEDGNYNWKLIGGIALVILVILLVLWLVFRTLALLWPVLLILIGISIISRIFRDR